MNRDSIVQFVGYSTPLASSDFIIDWQNFTQSQPHAGDNTKLWEVKKQNRKFNFLSTHVINEGGLQFSFEGKNSIDRFPDHRAKVTRMGGYHLKANSSEPVNAKGCSRILAFFHDVVPDIDSYRQIDDKHILVYEPYYENSRYSCIIEYSTDSVDSNDVEMQIKSKNEAFLILTLAEC